MFVPPSGALADDNNFQDDICSYAEGDAAGNQDFGTNAGGQITLSFYWKKCKLIHWQMGTKAEPNKPIFCCICHQEHAQKMDIA